MKKIKYRTGYKYQLWHHYELKIDVYPMENIRTRFIDLDTDGFLTIFKGYAWDGASGPTIDTKSSMRGSLIHDALYQLMRMGLLAPNWRYKADEILYEICREDGMSWVRANVWEKAVNWFAQKSATKAGARRVLVAP